MAVGQRLPLDQELRRQVISGSLARLQPTQTQSSGSRPYCANNNVPNADGDSSSSAQLQISELALTGDFNRDGHIDAADIVPAMEALTNPSTYATDFGLTDPNLSLIEDVNGDSSFTNADLQALLDLLKSGGGSADSVPEPPSLMLATLALLAVYSYRHLHQQVGFR
jgi:hypothetical protein